MNIDTCTGPCVRVLVCVCVLCVCVHERVCVCACRQCWETVNTLGSGMLSSASASGREAVCRAVCARVFVCARARAA